MAEALDSKIKFFCKDGVEEIDARPIYFSWNANTENQDKHFVQKNEINLKTKVSKRAVQTVNNFLWQSYEMGKAENVKKAAEENKLDEWPKSFFHNIVKDEPDDGAALLEEMQFVALALKLKHDADIFAGYSLMGSVTEDASKDE